MAIIEIPVFDGGLVTYADPEDLPNTAATTSVNFETDVPGKLVKRQGRGAAVTLTGNHVGQILKWTHEDLANPVWIYFEPQTKKLRKCAANFTSAANVASLATAVTDVEFSNYGRKLRFANGLDEKSGIYQHIDREFFFGEHTWDALYYDNGMMELPATWDLLAVEEIEGGMKQSGYYNYKFVPVFDGNQESPLPEGAGLTHESTEDDLTLKVGIQLSTQANDFNPRITSIKVYRSYSDTATGNLDAVYYHIHTIPLNTKADSDDILGSSTVTPMDNWFYSDDLPATTAYWGGYANSEGYRHWIMRDSYPGTSYEVDTYTVANYPGPGMLKMAAPFPADKNRLNGRWSFYQSFDDGYSATAYTLLAEGDYGGYYGKNLIFNNSWDWRTGEADGWVIYSDAESLDAIATGSSEKFIQLSDDLTQTGDFDVDISDGYRYAISGDDVTLWFYDYANTDRSLHPLGTKTKTTVNYKYSVYASGRNFVGNVRLDPDGEAEDHADWIIYSELGQPDVLPIVNYIQIKDTQGGQITGLTKHMGELAVFMSRGVYRLSVSSDPRHFALIESDENIGCIAPNSIITVAGQTFFAGLDNAYVIDSSFNIQPITEPIKDIYQGSSNLEESRFFYDPKKARILCRFGSNTQNIYSFDIIKAREGQAIWSLMDLGANTGASIFAIDENLNVFSITNEV